MLRMKSVSQYKRSQNDPINMFIAMFYRCALEGAEKLFSQVQDTVFKLAKLADERLHRLEQCLQLRQFEKQSSEVNTCPCDTCILSTLNFLCWKKNMYYSIVSQGG